MMDNFLIGMHGRFDYFKYNRDFKPGFFGIEACMFPGEEEADELANKAIKLKITS